MESLRYSNVIEALRTSSAIKVWGQTFEEEKKEKKLMAVHGNFGTLGNFVNIC